jgi:hypothetical protein
VQKRSTFGSARSRKLVVTAASAEYAAAVERVGELLRPRERTEPGTRRLGRASTAPRSRAGGALRTDGAVIGQLVGEPARLLEPLDLTVRAGEAEALLAGRIDRHVADAQERSRGGAKPQRARADSNGRPLAPEASALSTELRAQCLQIGTFRCRRRLGRSGICVSLAHVAPISALHRVRVAGPAGAHRDTWT